ncbi:MAG: TrkA C-terminal domain-containing protein, partial [Planctomycetota bacterium]
MGLFLFIIVLVVSFIAVRIGAIAFQLTGLNWELAKFQALSCFTGTGFTTRESELIVGHGQRRKIASV